MEEITLPFLKQRVIGNKSSVFHDNITNNIKVSRYRMDSKDPTYIGWEIDSMTHDGNSPKSNEDILDTASICAVNNIYTEEEWEKYFLPAIKKVIERNNNFVRWMPGDLIRCVTYGDGFLARKGDTAIVEHDYAAGFGGRDYTSLSVYSLDNQGNIERGWAWADYYKWELVNSAHRSEYIEKIRKYNKENNITPPLYLSKEMIDLFY